jgi:iron complex outermembrane receptor protein
MVIRIIIICVFVLYKGYKLNTKIRSHKSSSFIAGSALLALMSFSAAANDINSAQIDTSIPMVEEIEVILVSGKRDKSSFESAVSMNVLKGDDIEKVQLDSVGDIAQRQANLYLTNFTRTTPSITIRGLGFSDDESDSSSNSIYIDGVPIYGQALGQIFDLDSVEILRGPQSTLYGQSSNGGIIALHSRDPDFEFGGNARIDYGTANRQKLMLSADLPLSDKSALRVSLGGESSDGYIENTALSQQNTGSWDNVFGRLKWLYQDNHGGELRIGLHHMKIDAGNDYFSSKELAKKHQSMANEAGFNNTQYSLFSGQYTRPIGEYMQFSAIAGANTTRWEYAMPSSIFGGDSGFYTADNSVNALETKQLMGELRLSGEQGYIDWLAGLYIANIEREAPYLFDLSPMFLSETLANVEGETHAFFVDVGYHLSRQWRLSTALRYEKNTRSMHWSSLQSGLFDSDADGIPDFPFEMADELDDVNANDNEWLPSANLEYTPNRQIFAWLRLARGYKASGFNLFATSAGIAQAAYAPEYGDFAEVGYRLRATDNKWSVDIALFNMDIKDQQVVGVDSQGRTFTSNAAKAHSRGIEFNANIVLTDNIELRGYAGLVEAKFDNYIRGEEDFSGQRFPNAPKSNYGLSLHWQPNTQWQTGISLARQSSSSLFPNSHVKTDGYTLVDVYLSYQINDRFQAGFYAKNLLDEDYLTRAINDSIVVAGDPVTLGFYLKLSL